MKYIGKQLNYIYYTTYQLYEYFQLDKKVLDNGRTKEGNEKQDSKGNGRKPDIP